MSKLTAYLAFMPWTWKKHSILFGFILLIINLFYGVHYQLSYGPRSSHFWRQSDCATLAKNYQRNGLKFFKPRFYNRQENEGYNVGEFPGTYFIAGALYGILGHHDGILRLLHGFIMCLGLWAMFLIIKRQTDDWFYAYAIPIFFLSSPPFAFYGFNFLPDIPAFSLLIIGWYYLFKYLDLKEKRWIYWAFLFFTFAGLLKITLLVSLLAVSAIFFFQQMNWFSYKEKYRLHHVVPYLISLGLMSAILVLWYSFSIWYNTKHGGEIFLNTTFPIWSEENMNKLTYTLFRTFYFWPKYYFGAFASIGIFLLGPFVLFTKYQPDNFFKSMVVLCFIGALGIYHLWFYQYQDHDYYIIHSFPYILFLLLAVVFILKTHFYKMDQSMSFRVIVIAFILFNIFSSKKTLEDRYGGYLDYTFNPALSSDGFQGFLNKNGITKETKIVSVPDWTPNASLYLMDQPGFTEWKDSQGRRIGVESMYRFIQQGAHFLVVDNKKMFTKDGAELPYIQREYLQPFLQNKVGEYEGLYLYDLRDILK